MKNEEEGVYTRENSRTCKTISAFILEKISFQDNLKEDVPPNKQIDLLYVLKYSYV